MAYNLLKALIVNQITSDFKTQQSNYHSSLFPLYTTPLSHTKPTPNRTVNQYSNDCIHTQITEITTKHRIPSHHYCLVPTVQRDTEQRTNHLSGKITGIWRSRERMCFWRANVGGAAMRGIRLLGQPHDRGCSCCSEGGDRTFDWNCVSGSGFDLGWDLGHSNLVLYQKVADV